MNEATQKHRVVCIGGGTGTFVVLKGLKTYPYKLTAIVSMSDSGGSNKRIRDEFGLLPTSDIRQCFVALSDENGGVGLLRKLFMYRFEKGEGITGMTFGNLFMAALTDIVGSQDEAIRETAKVLRIHGSVIPVSLEITDLKATYEDGSVVSEEHFIDEPEHDGALKITSLTLDPPVHANPEALHAIEKASLIVLGPGDLFTSVLPNLIVSGMKEALAQTHAHIVYVMNLMTKYGQTYNFTAMDHIRTLEKYIGQNIDTVIINTESIPAKALEVYAKHHEQPIIDDCPKDTYFTILRGTIISDSIIKKSQSDDLVRSLIRHDSQKLARMIVSMLT